MVQVEKDGLGTLGRRRIRSERRIRARRASRTCGCSRRQGGQQEKSPDPHQRTGYSCDAQGTWSECGTWGVRNPAPFRRTGALLPRFENAADQPHNPRPSRETGEVEFEVGPPRLVALQPVATRQRVLVAHDNLGYFPAGGNELESASTFECHAAPRLRLNVGYLFERRHESVATVNGQSVGPKFCLSSVVMLSASSTLPGGSPNTDSVLDRRSHDKVCRTPLFHSALKVVPSVWMEPPFHDSLRRHAHDITSCDGPGRRFHDIERRFRMGPQEATVPAFGNTLRRRHE